MAAIGGIGNPLITGAATTATTGTPQKAEQVNLGEHAIADMARRFDRFEKMEKTSETKKGKDVEYECRTCANRKYVDGSTDSGVSFQTPTQIDPQAAGAAVRAHENEHVTRNAAKAESEGLEARSTVAIHMAICPECGRSYVAGGTTTTLYTEKSENENENKQEDFAPIGGNDKKSVEIE
jgi:hypothetical protein